MCFLAAKSTKTCVYNAGVLPLFSRQKAAQKPTCGQKRLKDAS
jgi:hypothetical protein